MGALPGTVPPQFSAAMSMWRGFTRPCVERAAVLRKIGENLVPLDDAPARPLNDADIPEVARRRDGAVHDLVAQLTVDRDAGIGLGVPVLCAVSPEDIIGCEIPSAEGVKVVEIEVRSMPMRGRTRPGAEPGELDVDVAIADGVDDDLGGLRAGNTRFIERAELDDVSSGDVEPEGGLGDVGPGGEGCLRIMGAFNERPFEVKGGQVRACRGVSREFDGLEDGGGDCGRVELRALDSASGGDE
ncbi:MAG: hypothetical protein ACNA8W_04330 [Bradymonadaceae bacterium]